MYYADEKVPDKAIYYYEKAIEAGVGKQVTGYAGAEVDDRFAPPVKLSGTVESTWSG